MLPDRVSNPGPLTYESGAQPIALRSTAHDKQKTMSVSFEIKFIRLNRNTFKWLGKPRHSYAISGLV